MRRFLGTAAGVIVMTTTIGCTTTAWQSSSPLFGGRGIYHSPTTIINGGRTAPHDTTASSLSMAADGSLHGENSCFLPLRQLDQDYYAPRIMQIAGAYPGLTKEEFLGVKSDPAAEPGQWTYDFSDPEGPQLGTIAIDGSNAVAVAADPVVIIAEHKSLGVPMPKEITEAVDLVAVVDRAQNRFAERKFMVMNIPGESTLKIGAYPAKTDIPEGGEILGHVVLTQIPWLPSMKPTKTGFMEADEYF